MQNVMFIKAGSSDPLNIYIRDELEFSHCFTDKVVGDFSFIKNVITKEVADLILRYDDNSVLLIMDIIDKNL